MFARKSLFIGLYVILVAGVLFALTAGIQNRRSSSPTPREKESENTKTTPRVSRDLENLDERDLTLGELKITDETSEDYFLSTRYHKDYFPSNKIWSSVPAKGELQGSYFLPWAAKGVDGALLLDLPQIRPEGKFVLANIAGDGLRIGAGRPVTEIRVRDFSDFSVRFEHWSEDDLLYETLFMQGSPYVYLYPEETKDFTVRLGRFEITEEEELELTDAEKRVLVAGYEEFVVENREITLTGKNREPLVFGVYTGANNRDVMRAGAAVEIEQGWADYRAEEEAISTRYTLTDALDRIVKEPLPLGFLEHHLAGDTITEAPLFTLETIRGVQSFYQTDSREITLPLREMVNELEFDIPEARKELILTTLRAEIDELEINSTTSYFGAKELARAARLLELARVLEQPDLVSEVQTQLQASLEEWFSYDETKQNQYFEWDKVRGGLIARKEAFGSQDYNDHHFHYGYFLYAASVVAEEDPEFLKNYREFIDLIAYDIANVDRDYEAFPYVRTFDFYEGHSWASGEQPFASGNNQESTSEAINAWYSLWRWGQVSDNEVFVEAGQYLYTAEINSTEHYWLNGIEGRDLFPEGYDFDTASLVWGGKYEYTTFFSPDPRAIEGIQYLPITPGAIYLNNEYRINRDRQNFRARSELTLTEGPLVDYNVAYYGILEGWDILTSEELSELPIDDGNSRANLYHWLSYWESQK